MFSFANQQTLFCIFWISEMFFVPEPTCTFQPLNIFAVTEILSPFSASEHLMQMESLS